jgi:hypothetical protein
VPNVGDDVILDVEGGTLACFWLDVFETMTLRPDTEYLVAGVVPDDGRWILVAGNHAYSIAGGLVSSTDTGHVPTAIKPLLGMSVSDLPPLAVVTSLT